MNKSDLVDIVAAKTETKKLAQEIVDDILDGMLKAIKKKEDIAIAGFGNFKVKKTKAREGRNPATGATIKIKAKNKLGFKAAKAVDELLNGK
jgi:DNA-binding protein HU-beta